MGTSTIKAGLTVSDGENYSFPEETAAFEKRTRSNGICFSGGGTRSLSATLGQLRALNELELIPNIRYISCVSGGSWAATAFTYYKTGATNDQEFLGPAVSSSNRGSWSLDDWGSSLKCNCLGYTATLDFFKKLEYFKKQGPADQAWQKTVGATYFERFGLNDDNFFSLDSETVATILNNNPQAGWTASDFDVPRAGRPFLIINSTVLWPVAALHHVNRVLMQYTPLYVGTPFLLTLEEGHIFGHDTPDEIGGGFLESFAYQSTGPTSEPSIVPAGSGSVEMPAPPSSFTLWQASGTSSAAFAYDSAKTHLGTEYIPRATYWPAACAGQKNSFVASYYFGDGGNLENYGIMALLQRQVENIVVFINSETPITKDSLSGQIKIDTDLPPLFGAANKNFPNNTVFPIASGELDSLIQELYSKQQKALQQEGGLAMAKRTYDVVANPWYGIKPYSVNVLWVYNALVGNWLSQLNQTEVAPQVIEGAKKRSGPLRRFPNYATVMDDPFHLVELTAPQVTLLADMFYWAITQQPGYFKTWLAAPND